MFRVFKRRKFGLAGPVIAAICLPPMAVVAFSLHAQSAASSSSRSAATSAQSSDFDSAASRTLFVSPVTASMVRGERAAIGAFDNQGRNVSSKAEWSLSNSDVAKLVTGNGSPYIIAKMPGEVTLQARIGEKESSCQVRVYAGTKLPPGVVAWKAAKIPGFMPRQAVLAAPAARPNPSAPKKSKSM